VNPENQGAADLRILVVNPAAARKITPTTMATMPLVERWALAREAGEVMVPRTLGSDLAGSAKYKMPAMIARTAMIARMATVAILAGDEPDEPDA
jgi:hypothetical protein